MSKAVDLFIVNIVEFEHIFAHWAEACLRPYQTSLIELLCENS